MYVGIIGCKITSLRGLSMEEITTLNVRKKLRNRESISALGFYDGNVLLIFKKKKKKLEWHF